MEFNADQSTPCFQNLPIPPCPLAETEFPNTAFRASWKINQDHLARLVSSSRKDFAYYQYNNKKNNDTSLRGGIGKFLIPGRPRRSACFCVKARLMWVTSHKEDKHGKLWLICREKKKKWKILKVERFRRGQTLLTGLSSHCFKQQKQK